MAKPRARSLTSRNTYSSPRSLRRLEGKTALITGASRGIGLAIARFLAKEGCDLAISGRDSVALEKAGRELAGNGVRVLGKRCDVRQEAAVTALLASVKREFRRLDILVNNAGVAHSFCRVRDLPPETWREAIETNLTGTFLVTRSALPLMRRGGIIVNNLSIAAGRVFPGSSGYNSAKHGGLGFTNTLREELRADGIRVMALLAGATDTDIWTTLWPEAPRKKMMSSETVAAAVVEALLLPQDAAMEELRLMPPAGSL